MWKKYENGATIGQVGSEGGTIIYDEEYNSECHITLEKCPKYSAITCGIYGLMVHTAFCDREHPEDTYESMKTDLQNFLNTKTTDDEYNEFCDKFVNKY